MGQSLVLTTVEHIPQKLQFWRCSFSIAPAFNIHFEDKIFTCCVISQKREITFKRFPNLNSWLKMVKVGGIIIHHVWTQHYHNIRRVGLDVLGHKREAGPLNASWFARNMEHEKHC